MSEPTLVITAASGATKIVSKLYGPLTVGRVDREQKLANHRAEQLNPAKFERPRERVYGPGEFITDDDE